MVTWALASRRRCSASPSPASCPRRREFKQGKSLLVNALINADVCPVDDDVATAVPTIVRHGEESATLVFAGNGPDDELPPPLERRAVPLEELEQYVAERGNPGNERRLACAEVSVPRRILENGLVLVDTPGVGGIGSAHAASTIAELPLADAVLMVSDAGQEYRSRRSISCGKRSGYVRTWAAS